MKKLVYRPEAEADVRSAFEWYERQREGLGADFIEALRQAEDRVQRSPFAFRTVRRDARRLLLRRFPYQLIYRVVDEVVVVVACFHGRRAPRRLERRR